MSERIGYKRAAAAVSYAAAVTRLPLVLQAHGTIGNGPGYSITVGENGSRIGSIGTAREIYYLAHAISDAAYAMRAQEERTQ